MITKVRMTAKNWLVEMRKAIVRERLYVQALEETYEEASRIGRKQLQSLLELLEIARQNKRWKKRYKEPKLKQAPYTEPELPQHDYLVVAWWAYGLLEQEIDQYPNLFMERSGSIFVEIKEQGELAVELAAAQKSLKEMVKYMTLFYNETTLGDEDEIYELPVLDVARMRISYSKGKVIKVDEE
jgi:hypothetical protein